MVDRPQFGEKVVVKALAKKDHQGNNTVWKRKEGWNLPRTGMYIGKRTVFDGKIESGAYYGYDEDPYDEPYFSQTQKHEVWLVVFNEHENPVRVFPEDTEKVND